MDIRFERIIRERAVDPVRSVRVDDTRWHLVVVFRDGRTASHKIDTPLRQFLACMTKCRGVRDPTLETDGCITQPLRYYDLLGYREGDRVLFGGGETEKTLPILFSGGR